MHEANQTTYFNPKRVLKKLPLETRAQGWAPGHSPAQHLGAHTERNLDSSRRRAKAAHESSLGQRRYQDPRQLSQMTLGHNSSSQSRIQIS